MSHDPREVAPRSGANAAEQALLAFVTRDLLQGRGPTVGAETRLFEDRIIDSMSILRLIGYIERHLGRRLDEKEIVMPKFRTVRTMVEAFFHD
jgi:acyl carrier protein